MHTALLRTLHLAWPWSTLLLCACSATGPAPDEEPIFYPDPPDPPRIQFLRTVSVGRDIEPGRSGLDTLLFGKQEVDKAVMAPYGATVHKGIVYVCDIQQGLVLTLDFPGQKLSFFDLKGRARLTKPVNLDFAADGLLYIADLGRRQIVVVDEDGQYQAEFGPWAEESRPTDVKVHGETLYVADAGSKCIRVLRRSDGSELLVFGNAESEKPLRAPTNLEVDKAGNSYVVDTIDCAVHVYDKEGNYTRQIGSAGDVVGQFARPKGIALLEELLFVVDAAFENCQILDMQGEPLLFFGGPGVESGDLYLPAGVWVGEEGVDLFRRQLADDFHAERLIIITNQYGPHKINFYALGRSDRFEYPEDEG